MRASVLVACFSAIASTGARAQTDDLAARYPVCENRDGRASAQDRVAACSAVLGGAPLAPAAEAMAHVNRAWAYSVEGRMAEARADYDIAVTLNPGSYVIYNERGLFNLRVGQFDAALSDYDAALKLAPQTAYSLYGRGLTLLRQGQTASGQDDLEAARRLDSKVDRTFRALGFAP
jgi:lipoprotein NlpI